MTQVIVGIANTRRTNIKATGANYLLHVEGGLDFLYDMI